RLLAGRGGGRGGAEAPRRGEPGGHAGPGRLLLTGQPSGHGVDRGEGHGRAAALRLRQVLPGRRAGRGPPRAATRAERRVRRPGDPGTGGAGLMRISRANLALVLAAAGAFLLTLIPLMRLYVSAQVFRAPLEQQSMTRSVAESATYLAPATMRIRTGTLVQTRWLLGVVLAGDEQRAVWGESLSLETEDGLRLDYHERRTGFDRRTGVTVNCCGAYVDE